MNGKYENFKRRQYFHISNEESSDFWFASKTNYEYLHGLIVVLRGLFYVNV